MEELTANSQHCAPRPMRSSDQLPRRHRSRNRAGQRQRRARDRPGPRRGARIVADAASELRRAEEETARAGKPRRPPSSEPTAPSNRQRGSCRIRRCPARARRLHAATDARLAALEETRDALRIRSERAEADLDTQRAENRDSPRNSTRQQPTPPRPTSSAATDPPRPAAPRRHEASGPPGTNWSPASRRPRSGNSRSSSRSATKSAKRDGARCGRPSNPETPNPLLVSERTATAETRKTASYCS